MVVYAECFTDVRDFGHTFFFSFQSNSIQLLKLIGKKLGLRNLQEELKKLLFPIECLIIYFYVIIMKWLIITTMENHNYLRMPEKNGVR